MHGWFGHGTSKVDAARLDDAAYAAIAHLPRSLRGHAAATFDAKARDQLHPAAQAWHSASHLPDDVFRDRYLPQRTSLTATQNLRALVTQAAAPLPATQPLPPAPIWRKQCSKSGWTIGGQLSPPPPKPRKHSHHHFKPPPSPPKAPISPLTRSAMWGARPTVADIACPSCSKRPGRP